MVQKKDLVALWHTLWQRPIFKNQLTRTKVFFIPGLTFESKCNSDCYSCSGNISVARLDDHALCTALFIIINIDRGKSPLHNNNKQKVLDDKAFTNFLFFLSVLSLATNFHSHAKNQFYN